MAGRIAVQRLPTLSRLAAVTAVRTQPFVANFSTSQQLNLKEIVIKNEGNLTTVEGVFVESPREKSLLKDDRSPHPEACPLCRLNLKIKYTDVLIISQFVKADGTVLPQHVTKLCKRQDNNIKWLVNKAKRAGLLQSLNPPGPDGKPEYKPEYKFMKYNVHFKY